MCVVSLLASRSCTVVSSLCRRGADKVCAISGARRTSSNSALPSFQSSKVERGTGKPWRPKIMDWRFSGTWSAKVAVSICASRLASALHLGNGDDCA